MVRGSIAIEDVIIDKSSPVVEKQWKFLEHIDQQETLQDKTTIDTKQIPAAQYDRSKRTAKWGAVQSTNA